MTLDDFLDWIAKHPKEWAEYQEKTGGYSDLCYNGLTAGGWHSLAD